MTKISRVSKTTWILIAAFCVLIFAALSFAFPNETLKLRAAGVLIASIVLWISEALPISISTLLLLSFLPLLGLMDYNSIFEQFGINTALFIMASSGITIALASSAIPSTIMNSVFGKASKKPILLIYSFGLVVSFFSAFVSSLATCTLFTMMTSAVLKKVKNETKIENLSKALMLTIPACAGIGGFMSPAGTPANLLVMDLLKENGYNITFAKWCAIGFPVGIIAVLIFVTSVVLHFKIETSIELETEKSKMTKTDYIILVVVIATIIGWVMSSFIPSLSITLIAILSLCILLIPKLDVLEFKEFETGVNWDLVLAMGSVSVLMSAISGTGLIQDIVNATFDNIDSAPWWIVLVVVSICICFLRAFIPTTTAVIALFAPLVISVSLVAELNGAALLLILAFWAASALLLVYTEPIYLIAYKEGYFKATDLIKVGVTPSLLLSVIASFLIYNLVGFIL